MLCGISMQKKLIGLSRGSCIFVSVLILMFMRAGLKPLLAMFDFRFLAVRNGVRPFPDPWGTKLSGLPRGSFSALQAKRRVFQESRFGFLQETRTTGPVLCSTGTCTYLESGKNLCTCNRTLPPPPPPVKGRKGERERLRKAGTNRVMLRNS